MATSARSVIPGRNGLQKSTVGIPAVSASNRAVHRSSRVDPRSRSARTDSSWVFTDITSRAPIRARRSRSLRTRADLVHTVTSAPV